MGLSLSDIARFYGARLIFKNVSLELRPGTVTLLVGPNGAGKSTLLKIMAGLIRPSAGRVFFSPENNGGKEDAEGENQARVGYLGHGTFMYPGLSALENLAFWSAMHGMRPAEQELFEALDRMGLSPFAAEKAGGFSRGMSQRLNLARLFLLQPDILLLDEPGTGLDSRSTGQLRREIARFADNGAVVVWITHAPQEDLPLAHHVALLDKGRLRLFNEPQEYLDHAEKGEVSAFPQKAPTEEAPATRGAEKALPTKTGPDAAHGTFHKKPSFFGAALAVARKDLLLAVGRGSGLLQAMLLGLLLVFVFSLSLLPGERMSPEAAAAVFWMASAFCQVLIFSSLHAHEEDNQQRHGLLLAPVPIQAVWLGKMLAGGCLLLCAQLLFLPSAIVFLAQSPGPLWPVGLGILVLADFGIICLGSLLGALSQGRTARESLLSIVLFPLLTPMFLVGIRLGAAAFGGPEPADMLSWFGMACAFNAIFLAAALVLFPHVYTAEE